MLGQPLSMLIPQVVGFRLHGKLREGSTATDLVLTVTQILRKAGVVGKLVEFFGPGVAALPVADRATIANMAPEYGATCGIFPIDDETLRYLRFSGRAPAQVELVEAYAREQGLFQTPHTKEAVYTTVLDLDLASVEPSVAGPKRPQDRVSLFRTKQSFEEALPSLVKPKKKGAVARQQRPVDDGGRLRAQRARRARGQERLGRDRGDHQLHEHVEPVGDGGGRAWWPGRPSTRASPRKPWVKTSLAPGSKVVTEYLAEAGLTPYLDKLGFNTVGYGCTTCIGNSGPLPQPISDAIDARDLVVASVLSGNRNFEGRINPDVRANYLMSPPLVVAYALAGRIDIDLEKEPVGQGKDGQPVYLKRHLADQPRDLRHRRSAPCSRRCSRSRTASSSRATSAGASWTCRWATRTRSTRRRPTSSTRRTSRGCRARRPRSRELQGARVLAVLGDSVTTDHISPAGSIKKDGPGRAVPGRPRRRSQGLQQLRRPPRQPRGDGPRHVRERPPQEPAGARDRGGRDAPPAGRRRHVDLRGQREVRGREGAAADPGGQRVRVRLLARLGRQGAAPAGRPLRHRRELRAHPPQQPGRDGDRPLAVPRGRIGRGAGPDRRRGVRDGWAAGAADLRALRAAAS